MNERKGIAFFIIVMATISLMMASISIAMLYLTAVADERGRLIEIAQRQARLIDSISRFNKLHNTDYPGGPDAATLSQIIEADEHNTPQAETFEIVIGRRVGDRIEFLMWKNRAESESPKTLASDTPLAEPMRRALSGLSGTLVGLDYRAEKVLAAYEPAPDLNAGVVVKINLAEVRAPFIRAGAIAAVLGLPLVLVGTLLFVRVSNLMIRRISESGEKLRLAEEMGHLGHWSQDLRTDSISWSNEMYRIFGVKKEDFTHTHEGILHLIHPEDRAYLDRITETIKREEKSDFEYRVIRPDGGLRYVTGKAEIVRDESGEAVAIFGTTLDATEIKQKERELREQNAELERFTYTVSHDLKSPLVTIETFLGYLKQDIAGSDFDRIDKDMNFMRTATFKMRNLLEELLEMSRVGRVVNNPVRVTFRELVEEALGAAAGPIAQRGVEVRVGKERITLYGDRPRLAEIWQNLIDNAVKFMGDQASPLIEIGAEKSGENITFFVRDNGMGIESQYQTKVLGLFEKLNPNIEGSGLGLALIKRIAELYRGTIWLESQGAGQGTCFRFTLPEAQTNRRKGEKI